MARTESDILKDLALAESALKESRSKVNRLHTELLDAETILIGDKLRKEKLLDELRRWKANNQ